MNIILLRHGKPDVSLKGLLNAVEIKQLVAAYQLSTIQDAPPKYLYEQFNNYYVVCSDLPRSLKSANKIGFSQADYKDGLFSEADLPHFDQSKLRLPVTVWVIVLRVMWIFGFKKNGESFKQAKSRAQRAAIKLIALAEEHENIILVGHGLMNRLIAKQLSRLNWRGPVSPGKKYWQFGRYKKEQS